MQNAHHVSNPTDIRNLKEEHMSKLLKGALISSTSFGKQNEKDKSFKKPSSIVTVTLKINSISLT